MSIMRNLQRRFSLSCKKEDSFFNDLKLSLTQDGSLGHVGQLLERTAKKHGSKTALIFGEQEITYQELYHQVVLFAQKLRELGVQPNDRVILYVENSPLFYIGYFAIWQIGAVNIPLNVFLHERELAYVAADSGTRVIITAGKLLERVKSVAASQEEGQRLAILTEVDVSWKTTPFATAEECTSLCPIAERGCDELCLLLYTSGTTGTPKGVMLSSRNVLINTMQATARFAMYNDICDPKNQERFLATLPLFHVFAQNTCMWMPVMLGSAIVIVPRIDRCEILNGLKKKPTIFLGVPALYGLLCLLKTAPLDSVKFFVSGGDALPDKIRAAFGMIYGRKICSGYGLTEASPVVSINMDNPEADTHVVGRPLAGIECVIRNESGKSVDVGEVGELWVRGENVMMGYYNEPKATAAVLKDGWLDTGDLATFDKKGKLALMGRSKELIIHKGFNIYPQEVENILLSHPSVFKAAVIGKEDAIAGQVPVAFVALKDKSKNIESKLREFCLGYLATYKVPRKFICLDDLPMNATGKINKKELKIDALE